ncbi:transcriptional regulator, AlpA family [gamma proteobacterium NOR5-3]|nr:transcriptional regulator, AlpA family [gamma proteobacterium NOR5-3]
MQNALEQHLSRYDRGGRLIRLRRVQDLTGLSRSYIYALAAQGRFPKSVALVPGGTSRAWVESEVFDWLEQRIAERDLEARHA